MRRGAPDERANRPTVLKVQAHTAARPLPATRGFDHELTGPAAAVVATVLLAACAWVSVALTERLGVFFGLCLVLAALTVALVVDTRGLFVAGVLPPLLLLGVLTMVVMLAPSAIDAPHLATDAGHLQRVIAGVVDHATALVVGHLAALTIVGLRIRVATLD